MKPREKWIDASKGLLIFLVVAGHAFGAASHIGNDVFVMKIHENIYKVIYFFHMPAFFLLAGMTWSDGGKGFWKYAQKKARRLLLPYFVFMMLSMFVEYMWAGNVEWHRLFAFGGSRLNAPLWFLPCMFFVLIAYYVIDKCNNSRCSSIVIPLLLIIIGFMTRHIEFSFAPKWISRFSIFLFFILIGNKLLPLKVWEKVPKFPIWLCVALIIGFAVIGYFIPWEALCSEYWWFGYRCVALVGALIVFAFCRALPSNMLCWAGIASLYILCLHKFPLVLAQMKMETLYELCGGWSLGLTLLLSLFCIPICVFAVRVYESLIRLIRKESK